MTTSEALHIAGGREWIRIPGSNADLENNPELWVRLWERFRGEILPDWIERHPGGRPEAWHEFDRREEPEQQEDESEVEWLFRCGLIEADELEAIVQHASRLADYNRGRDLRSNFIPPEGIERFAIDHGVS